MTLVHGVDLKLDRDRIALHVEAGKGDFEPETVAAFRAAIEADPEGCVIDVGAYTGLFTILAMHAGAKEIVALEPNPRAYSRLLENVEWNQGHPGYVTLLREAASFDNGVAFLHVTGEERAICSTGKIRLSPCEGALSVKLVTIDSIARRRPVSVMKIDVEGHELAALAGATVTLEAENPVLFIEVNSGSGGDRRAPIARHLAMYGYEGEPLDGRNMVFRVP